MVNYVTNEEQIQCMLIFFVKKISRLNFFHKLHRNFLPKDSSENNFTYKKFATIQNYHT